MAVVGSPEKGLVGIGRGRGQNAAVASSKASSKGESESESCGRRVGGGGERVTGREGDTGTKDVEAGRSGRRGGTREEGMHEEGTREEG
jgi:hypothetical protein